MIVAGARSEDDARLAPRKHVRIVQKLSSMQAHGIQDPEHCQLARRQIIHSIRKDLRA